MKKTLVLLSMSLLVLTVAGCAGPESEPAPTPTPAPSSATPPAPSPAPVPAPAPSPLPTPDTEIKVTPDGVKYIVDPDKIVGGGPPKDGIPSIDNPQFVSVEEADDWIQDNELVLTISYKGVQRVYPLQIMVWHEIVNEFIAGDPLLITY